MPQRIYMAIDLKSFYASVECVERGLDPLQTNLVVADPSRTEKTICLAVSPALKAYGIPGRARLFEVIQKVGQVNAMRRLNAPNRTLTGKSCDARELADHPDWALDYIIAPPQMAHYIQQSTRIYNVYLKYVAPEDIHSYSIDEVFLDATAYLKLYGLTPKEFARKMILDILATTGITATAGIGTNLYLAKVAMDIRAKHIQPDENGVRIAALDEMRYRRLLWDHTPLTDFWRVGKGIAQKLETHNMFTMGDVARCSLGGPQDFYNEEMLYRLFGVNAELLIDHAWGWEPCRMADQLALDLVDKHLMTNQLVLTVGYDRENLTDPTRNAAYHGPVATDRYGRQIPKHAHGTTNLRQYTSSTRLILDAVTELFDRIVDKRLLVRRGNLVACRVLDEDAAREKDSCEQLDFFSITESAQQQAAAEEKELERERRRQQAMLAIKKKFGKNAIIKGMDLQEGATAMERNAQIGGHKA